MKRIAISVLTITVVAIVGFAVTRAYFTDTEKSTGNTFSTGTIDIAVDGENPWSASGAYNLKDMKPSQTEYINFKIQNVGTNPVNVWKKLGNIINNNEPVSEPECAAEGGTWTANDGPCAGNDPKSNIQSVIEYDLSVELYNSSNELIWWQMIYDKNVTVGQIKDTNIFLGMIPVDWYMEVVQSYHMRANTENWAQGDTMTFDITLTGEQLTGTAVLEDKTGEPDWMVKTATAEKGTLKYGVKDSKFDFSFTGIAPLNDTPYSLIVYHESWSAPSGSGWPRSVTILGSDTSDGSGNVDISEAAELNGDLINAKIWLVKTGDLSGNTISGWNPDDYLFDTGLIDYYDTD